MGGAIPGSSGVILGESNNKGRSGHARGERHSHTPYSSNYKHPKEHFQHLKTDQPIKATAKYIIRILQYGRECVGERVVISTGGCAGYLAWFYCIFIGCRR